MTDLSTWAPLLLSLGLLVFLFEISGTHAARARAIAASLVILLTVRYGFWRVHDSLPAYRNPIQAIWTYLFLLVSSVLTSFFLSRTISRSEDADRSAGSPLLSAPTDVFIATYNESFDILERTLVGALAIEHPDLRVWMLDDGDRPWVRDLALSLGAHYVSRRKGKHAKAGNVNNGVAQALSTGRRPEFFLLLDADFVAHRSILRRTLGLFQDAEVGIVQTPQHFFNADPVQSNLLCTTIWPDEQRLFFNTLLPAKDAWGAAFCCGTSAVFRIQAFVDAGGMATETVTEDMLTTFKFGEFGYRTILLNERLSLGLAPESLTDFISQRSRWCLGAIQQIFTRWSFTGRGKLSLINRISFLDTILYWTFGPAFKILLVFSPIIYWFSGIAAIQATLPELTRWLAPMVLTNLYFTNHYGKNRALPIMTDVTQMLTAFVIVRTVATALVRPFGRPFKVTAKGLSTSGVTVQWRLLWPFAALAALTLLGVFLNVGSFSRAHGTYGYSNLVFWSFINVVVLSLAALACVELPHRRRDERFETSENVLVRLPSAFGTPIEIPCTLLDISLGGAAITSTHDLHGICGPAQLVLNASASGEEITLPFSVVNRRAGKVALQFHPDPWIRHALIRKLFTGDYHREIESISAPSLFYNLARVLVG